MYGLYSAIPHEPYGSPCPTLPCTAHQYPTDTAANTRGRFAAPFSALFLGTLFLSALIFGVPLSAGSTESVPHLTVP
jgi:hypothetical protein